MLYDAVPKSEADARELQKLAQMELASAKRKGKGAAGGGEAAVAAKDMPHYVPKEEIAPPQTIYEPDMTQGSEGITEV